MTIKKIFRRSALAILLLGGFWMVAQLFNYSKVLGTDSEHINSEYMSRYNVYAVKMPLELSFADEKVPLERWDVKESLDRELLVNTYWQSQTMLFLKRAHRFFPILEPILKECGVPEDFKYLALIESGLVPTIVSPSRAVGIWQFMKGTAQDYHLEVSSEVDERYNIEKSTRAACKYLKDSYKRYGNWTLVAATYNAGRRHISRQMALQDAGSYYDLLLGEETARYVYRILAVKRIVEDPSSFGYRFRAEDLYAPIPTYKVEIGSSVKSFALFAKEHHVNYKILKFFNPWLRRPYLTNKSRKKYYITLPVREYCNFDFSQYHESTGSLSVSK